MRCRLGMQNKLRPMSPPAEKLSAAVQPLNKQNAHERVKK